MTEYYVDPTATGDDDGSTQANAWVTAQRAIDGTDGTQPAAGDTVLCKHTGAVGAVDETLSVKIDLDGNVGTWNGGHIKYIGTNSSWVQDGSIYVIDANSAAANCLDTVAGTDYQWWENFVFKNATGHGVNFGVSGALLNVFVNCRFQDNGDLGYYGLRNNDGVLIQCLADGNSGAGFRTASGAHSKMVFCCSKDNSGYGLDISTTTRSVFVSCLVFDNTTYGMYSGEGNFILNSVVDNHSNTGIRVAAGACMIIGNRLTNNGKGLDAAGQTTFGGWNYFQDNTTNVNSGAVYQEFVVDGVGTDQEDQGDTTGGYKSLTEGSENYELATDATGFETAIEIPTGQ